ncbi:TetR/AcrR family transcriptional regulator [Sebaldella sp. S0638]|uniref:TetR/AcrR family transcriptional regulator n=1 Tax=Sebaldella sp. S0638 TaxID=2957809 RepID=UPI0020A0EDB6|nr:TetR/AcrR family transcriptional regulator [Sebaldella sp. S0638]MCP1225269.1 TetR/AcrR family transcriptional regulator [Sebaldella sp. S0638]
MDTKEKILVGMLELIWDKGLEKASIGSLAKKIKISPGNIYYYFTDKTEILNTLYYYCFEQLVSSVRRDIYKDIRDNYTNENVEDKIRYFLKEIIVFYRENPYILNYMITAKSSSYLSDDLKKRMLNYVESYSVFLDELKEKKMVKQIPTQTMILYFTTVIYEFLKQDVLLHNISLDDEKINDIVTLFLTGIIA